MGLNNDGVKNYNSKIDQAYLIGVESLPRLGGRTFNGVMADLPDH